MKKLDPNDHLQRFQLTFRVDKDFQTTFETTKTTKTTETTETIQTTEPGNDLLKPLYETLFRMREFYSNRHYEQFLALQNTLEKTGTRYDNVGNELNFLLNKKVIKSYFYLGKYVEIASLSPSLNFLYYDIDLMFIQAKSLFKCDKLKESQKIFQDLVELKTKFEAKSHFYLGSIYYKHGISYFPKAQRCFQNSFKLLQKIPKDHKDYNFESKLVYFSLKVAIAVNDQDTIRKSVQKFDDDKNHFQHTSSFPKAMILYSTSIQDYSKALFYCKNDKNLKPHQNFYYLTKTMFQMSQDSSFVGDKYQLWSDQLKNLKDQYFELFNGTILARKCIKIVELYTDISSNLYKNQDNGTQMEHLVIPNLLCHQVFEFALKIVGESITTAKLLNSLATIWMITPIHHLQNFQQINVMNTMIVYIDSSLNYLSTIFKDAEDINLISIFVETKYLKAMIYQYVSTIRFDNSMLQQAKQLYTECCDYFIIYDLQRFEDAQSKMLMCDPDLYGIIRNDVISDNESESDS